MKVKLKLDMDQLKEFGKEHGEKFGLAAAVLILGIFIVKAASRETLPEKLQASQIESRSQQADQKIKSLPAPPKTQDVTNVDFNGQVAKPPAPVGLDIPDLSQPTFPDLVKRVDPTRFPVEEIRVAAFRGGLVTSSRETGRGIAPGRPQLPGLTPGGLAPGRPSARPASARPATGASGRPATPAPGVGLVPAGLAGGAAQPGAPLPPDFFPGPQSTGTAEGHYGIVVTGLIPVQAQREEYDRRFKNARRGTASEGVNGPVGPARDRGAADSDSPEYIWSFLERTDTTAGKTILLNFGDTDGMKHAWQYPDKELQDATRALVKKLGISPAIGNKLEAAEHSWGAPPPEVVDRDFLAEKWFSWPLPPILLRTWGPEAAHPPKIPLAGPAAVPGAAPGDNPPTPGQDPGFADAPAAGPTAGPIPMRRRDPLGAGGKAPAVDVPYKLFRFVDLDVEPGHTYQYRVRMLLRNPNFGLEPQVLAKPDETRTVAFNPTPWSEMSPAVAVPQTTRLLGGSIERPRRQEPKAKVSVFTFDQAQAIELIKEFDTELGALVGTTVPDQVAKNVADPVQKSVRDITGEFRTRSVLLDFRGNDEKLPGASRTEGFGAPVALTDPAEMLLLDDIDHPENPRLIVVNEAKDAATIEDWKKTHTPPTAAASDTTTPTPKTPATTPKPATGLLSPGATRPGTPRRTPTRPN